MFKIQLYFSFYTNSNRIHYQVYSILLVFDNIYTGLRLFYVKS